MRAIKRTVSVLLSLMLVLGMVTMGISVASAAENTISATSNIAPQAADRSPLTILCSPPKESLTVRVSSPMTQTC